MERRLRPGADAWIGRRTAFACLSLGIAACAGGDVLTGVNVVLISLDSTRADLLGCYGRRPVHAPGLSPSPNLDRLATQGVLFENA